MGKEKKKPGVLLYFGDMAIVEQMNNEEAGEFFRAILAYAEFGTVPVFRSAALGIAWTIIRNQIDKDTEAYQAKLRNNSYAVYCREERKAGREPLSKDEWYQTVSDDTARYKTVSGDAECYQTISNTNSKSIPIPNSKPISKLEREYAPTREGVKAYVARMGYSYDADRFYDYYSGVGWKQNGSAIENWQAVADNWGRSERKQEHRKSDRQSGIQRHDAPLSPMMIDAVKRVMQQEEL